MHNSKFITFNYQLSKFMELAMLSQNTTNLQRIMLFAPFL